MRRIFAMLPLVCACSVTHLERNAPGSIRVREEPEHMVDREVEPQIDPGERMLLVRYGVLAAGGVAIPDQNGDTTGSYGVGPEVSLLYGTSSYSHNDDAFPIIPEQAFGGGIGWTTLLHPGESVGPVYGELEYANGPAWLAAGWAWEIDDALHGPQALVGYGPFFIRYTHLLDQGSILHFGTAFKGQASFIWNAPASETAADPRSGRSRAF